MRGSVRNNHLSTLELELIVTHVQFSNIIRSRSTETKLFARNRIYLSSVGREFYGRVLKVYVAVYFSEWFYQYPDLVHKTESTITKKGKILVFRTEALSGKRAKTQ